MKGNWDTVQVQEGRQLTQGLEVICDTLVAWNKEDDGLHIVFHIGIHIYYSSTDLRASTRSTALHEEKADFSKIMNTNGHSLLQAN